MSVDYNLSQYTDENDSKSIITDSSKLDIGHVPDKIPHRQHIIDQLLENTFSSVLKGEQGDHALLLGPPGTGKTATIKHLLKKIEEHDNKPDLEILYINCANRSSSQLIYEKMCNKLGLDFVRGKGLPENMENLFRYLHEESSPDLLVVLDEIHELHNTRSSRNYLNKPVLYSMTRPHNYVSDISEEDYAGNITFIGISNDKEIIQKIDLDMESSMDEQIHHFKEYTQEELVDILSHRQQKAYSEQILSKPALGKIAKEIAENFNGDVRKGIRILKNLPKDIESPSVVVNSQEKQIEIVESTIERIQRNKIYKVLYSKDDQFFLVMHALYQQLQNEKPHLKYVTESYSKACEYAMVEKRGDDYESRKSFVYRQLEYLVDIGLLEKTKDYSEPKNPNCYEAVFNLEVFREAVEDNLKRAGLLEELTNQDLGLTSEEQTASEEAEEVLNEHMGR